MFSKSFYISTYLQSALHENEKKLLPPIDHGHVLEACKDSLKKLRLDYLDLYLIHFPVATKHTGMILVFILPNMDEEHFTLFHLTE